jgi:hypothetical protein
MLDEVLWPKTPFPLEPSLLLVGRRGSESNGTRIPSSNPDRDLMGIIVPPDPWTLGLKTWEGAEEINGVWDVVLYDFRKFVRLLVKQNPNVLGMLWLEAEDYMLVTPIADRLIAAREMFRARMPAYEAFSGYARDQLQKMTTGKVNGTMGAKRKALVERFGFDCKNASQLVRLLHEGEEYQRTGRLQVRRTWDREMLIEIKTGEWSLERVKEYAEARFRKIAAAVNESVLPEAVDEEAVNALVVRIMRGRLQP